MQISNMLPVLLSILNGQAGQNKVNRAPPGQEMGEVTRQGTEKPSGTAAALGTGKVDEGDLQAGRQTVPGHSLPDFLPLPLKSPLFPESGFFIKNDREAAPGMGEDGRTGVFIRLRTENMGILWISLSAGKESLTVSFYTEKDTYTVSIKESFPALAEALDKLGYPSASLAGITRPGIRDCSDIAPGGKNACAYLLDLEV